MIEASIITKILQPFGKLGFVFYASRLLKKRMLKYHHYTLITSVCSKCNNTTNCLKNNIHYKRALNDISIQFGRYSFYSLKTISLEIAKHFIYMYSLKDWKIYKTQHDNKTWLRLGYCGTYDDFMRSGLLNENNCDNYEKVNEHIVRWLTADGLYDYDDIITNENLKEINKYIEE